MRKHEQKNVNVNMNSEIADEFAAQVEDRGQKKFRAIEGALRLWLTLTSQDQTRWIEGKAKPVFSTDPDENEIYVELDDLARRFAAVKQKIRQIGMAEKKRPRKHKA